MSKTVSKCDEIHACPHNTSESKALWTFSKS